MAKSAQKPKPAEPELEQETTVDFKQWFNLATELEEPIDELHALVCVLGQVGDNISVKHQPDLAESVL
jgi:hypothetical protein